MMTPEEWWKNFALGIEIDVAGTFIHNGIKALHELSSLNHPEDSFEVLYNLSVGIERLLKVAIILIEHCDHIDMAQFEKSLISHNTIDLANRVNSQCNLQLSNIHREFLSILSKFYKTHRYGRYSLSVVPEIYKEQRLFLDFVAKHLKTSLPIDDKFLPISNTDQIRRFVGKVVKKICDELFQVVCQRANELNINTAEIRGDSKALKIFYGKHLDFIDEKLKKKELLLFLMNPKSHGPHIDLLRSFDALELDPDRAPNYIQALLNDANLLNVEDEVDEVYIEVTNIRERLDFLEIVDKHLSYESEDEAEQFGCTD
jgi:hypothetical protein